MGNARDDHPRSSEHRFFLAGREKAERAVGKHRGQKKKQRCDDDDESTRRPLNNTGSFDR